MLNVCSWAVLFADHGIDPNRAGDVLEVLLAQIRELNSDLAANVSVNRSRNTDTAGFGYPFKSCRDVNVITEDIVGFDNNIANIDPCAEANALVLRIIDRQVMHAVLELNRGPNRFDSARKLR